MPLVPALPHRSPTEGGVMDRESVVYVKSRLGQIKRIETHTLAHLFRVSDSLQSRRYDILYQDISDRSDPDEVRTYLPRRP